MKNMMIRLALLIVCALSINTAFAQDVRQKPVVKKQPTTTITKQAPASTKKPATSTKTKQTGRTGGSRNWEYIGDFHEGLANVKDANGKEGLYRQNW